MSAERNQASLQPFPVDRVGRLAFTSLTVLEARPEDWKVIEGLSLGKSRADAVVNAGIESRDPDAYATNILRRKFGAGPFAVRSGVELGQIVQPYDQRSRTILREDQIELLDFLSRRVTVARLAKRDDYENLSTARNKLNNRIAELCDTLGAENLNHAVRLGFTHGVFPAVTAERAQEYYKNLLIARRMRDFLQMAYPYNQLATLEDESFLNVVQNLNIALGVLVMRAMPAVLRELPEKIEQFKQWLNGTEPEQIIARYGITRSKILFNRKALASEFKHHVPISMLTVERSDH